MATNPDIRDQAYQFFLEEAPELLQTIESGLLALQQQQDTAEIHQIMRAAHSLKGGAASVGLEPIKAIAHRLEAIFKALYSDAVAVDSDLETQLLQAFDCLRLPLTQQLTQGAFDRDQALAQAEPILQGLEQRLASAMAETENFIPSSSDLGFDMATSIFEIDVLQGLDHLARVLAQPEGHEVAGELRAQAEIFMGFAELLDLSGFAQIAETALQALAVNPEQVIEITRLAIADFSQGRAAVLANGSTTGGEPSTALLALATATATPDQRLPSLSELSLEPIAELLLTDSIDDYELNGEDWTSELTATAQFLEELTQPLPEPPLPSPTAPASHPPEAAPELVEALPSPSGDALEALFGDEAAIATPPPSPPSPLPLADPIPAPTVAAPIAPSLTVRVDTQRLARIDNQLGELTINRNGLALQSNQIRQGLRELVSRFERVRTTVEQLQGVSDQILIAPERQRQPVAVGEIAPVAPRAMPSRPLGFDSLEMDTYTALYSYTQTLLEDMVQLEEAAADIMLFNRQSAQLLGQHRKMLSQVQEDLVYARMVPLNQVLNRLPRVLRDLSNTYAKPAELTLKGTALLMDKAVLEKLYDPLLHLLRNGFDHGLELPAGRRDRAKPEVGQLVIEASYRGRQVVIEVSDDGRGLDLDRVRQRLIDLGWLSTAEASAASTDQLSAYIFEPGFSTADRVSELSGRGVGLDVVREQVKQLNGTVTCTVDGRGRHAVYPGAADDPQHCQLTDLFYWLYPHRLSERQHCRDFGASAPAARSPAQPNLASLARSAGTGLQPGRSVVLPLPASRATPEPGAGSGAVPLRLGSARTDIVWGR
jgi:chemotaxis family two-component system sensor histidine kinase/response regulator PixL